MTELKLTQLPNGQIALEMEGEIQDVSAMICRAMIANTEFASIVCGAIPTFLDEKKLDRAGYCKAVMEAHGSKKN